MISLILNALPPCITPCVPTCNYNINYEKSTILHIWSLYETAQSTTYNAQVHPPPPLSHIFHSLLLPSANTSLKIREEKKYKEF